ncbi:MAG: DNA polymerase III subunit delta, partial [Burkholderiales bacterium]
MNLRGDQLDQHLAKTLAPLYVIHGDEALLALEAADAIRAKARAEGCSERDVFVSERGFDWSALTHAAAGRSLFADRKLIELRIPTGKPGPDGGEVIEGYCANLVTENVTIVSVPRLSKKDQSTGWFTALSRAGNVVDVYTVERTRLPQWIAMRLTKQKQNADAEGLAFIADCVEGNLLAAHQEIQKLGLLYPAGTISFDQIRAAVLDVSRHDVFQLSEAMLAGDHARAVKVVESLKSEGEQAPRVVWVLAEELRALARIQTGMQSGRAVNDLLRENRVWGEPRTSLVSSAARRVTRTSLEAAILHVSRCERMSKGVPRRGEAGDVWDELLR